MTHEKRQLLIDSYHKYCNMLPCEKCPNQFLINDEDRNCIPMADWTDEELEQGVTRFVNTMITLTEAEKESLLIISICNQFDDCVTCPLNETMCDYNQLLEQTSEYREKIIKELQNNNLLEGLDTYVD